MGNTDKIIRKCKYQCVTGVQGKKDNFQPENIGRGREAYFVKVMAL